MSLNSLNSFMGSVATKQDSQLWEDYIYVATEEWKWSYTQTMETPLPFVLELLHKRKKVIDIQNKSMKKR